MTTDEIAMLCWYIFLFLVLVAEIVWVSHTVIRYRRDEKKSQAEQEERDRRETRQFYINAEYTKRDADKHGIEYAFGKAECDERNRIREAIDSQSHRGLYTCELDFPVSQRSLEWLQYGGFEVSQTDDGKTQVSWQNAN